MVAPSRFRDTRLDQTKICATSPLSVASHVIQYPDPMEMCNHSQDDWHVACLQAAAARTVFPWVCQMRIDREGRRARRAEMLSSTASRWALPQQCQITPSFSQSLSGKVRSTVWPWCGRATARFGARCGGMGIANSEIGDGNWQLQNDGTIS